jgi:hypothetical protein
MAPRGNNMIGMSRTVRDGRLVAFELLVLSEEGARLDYNAHPSGQPPAVFHSETVSDSLVVFENIEHDFPNTIGYRLESPDALLAWIEGTVGGDHRHVDFNYSRAACPGSR